MMMESKGKGDHGSTPNYPMTAPKTSQTRISRPVVKSAATVLISRNIRGSSLRQFKGEHGCYSCSLNIYSSNMDRSIICVEREFADIVMRINHCFVCSKSSLLKTVEFQNVDTVL